MSNILELKQKFQDDMWGLYFDTKKETKYNPEYFRKMLDEFGGFDTAKKLLNDKNVQSGLIKLWEFERLDLSVETLVLNKKYKKLFSEEELLGAYKRLDNLDYFKYNNKK